MTTVPGRNRCLDVHEPSSDVRGPGLTRRELFCFPPPLIVFTQILTASHFVDSSVFDPITLLSPSSPTQATLPLIMIQLDASCFPHILDAILSAAIQDQDERLIRTLRSTGSSVRDFIDRRIAPHAVCTRQDFEKYVAEGRPGGRRCVVHTAVGRIRLPFRKRRIAKLVRTLDVYSTKQISPLSDRVIQFPNLRYIRMFKNNYTGGMGPLPWDVSGLTVIFPLTTLQEDFADKFHATSPNCISRLITIAPRHMYLDDSDGASDSDDSAHLSGDRSSSPQQPNIPTLTETGGAAASSQFVGKEPSGLPFGKDFVGAVYTYGETAHDLDIRLEQRSDHACRLPLKECTIVGPEELTRNFVQERMVAAHPCRAVSLLEWRAAITDEEWALIETIPKSMWIK